MVRGGWGSGETGLAGPIDAALWRVQVCSTKVTPVRLQSESLQQSIRGNVRACIRGPRGDDGPGGWVRGGGGAWGNVAGSLASGLTKARKPGEGREAASRTQLPPLRKGPQQAGGPGTSLHREGSVCSGGGGRAIWDAEG